MNSEERRLIKKVVMEQRGWKREGTWYGNIRKVMNKYGLKEEVEGMKKSSWKRKVKEAIQKETEKQLRRECKEKKKARTVKDDEYKMKKYLTETTISQSRQILKARLHMVEITCNYKKSGEDERCQLCGKKERIETEHYFRCERTEEIKKNWNVQEEHLKSSETMDLIRVGKYFKEVVNLILIEITQIKCSSNIE